MARGTVNKVILLGRLGQDPEQRATASGTQIATLNLATNELGPKDAQGNRQNQTEWHRVVLFGTMAANALQYLVKGSQVYIEGRLRTRKWQDQSGADRYSTEIVGTEMQFIGSKSASGQQATGKPNRYDGRNGNGYQPAPGEQGAGAPPGQPSSNFDDFDDDIPF